MLWVVSEYGTHGRVKYLHTCIASHMHAWYIGLAPTTVINENNVHAEDAIMLHPLHAVRTDVLEVAQQVMEQGKTGTHATVQQQ